MRHARLTALLLAGLGSSGGGAVIAQEPTPPVFGAEATLVSVPVFVTDGSGRSVAGLTVEDFELQDDGRPVAIRAFQAIDVEHPGSGPQADVPEVVRAVAPRQFLLLFELSFSPYAGILKARKAAMQFVEQSLRPGDLVAVATYSRKGFRMLTNFTLDHAFAARAVRSLGLGPEFGGDRLALTGGFEDADTAVPASDSAELDDQIRSQLASLQDSLRVYHGSRVADMVGTLDDVVRALAPLEGRKQIVLFSGGVDESIWKAPDELTSTSLNNFTVLDSMRRVFRAAGQSDVAIHTVNLAGIEADVDVASPTGRNAQRRTGYDSLAALAENTGGRFVLPTNDFARALDDVDQASRAYYVLAFEPAEPRPKAGKPRSLDVRVRRSGLHVSHRAAWVLPKPASGTDLTQLRLAAAEAVGKGLTRGPLHVRAVGVPFREPGGGASLSTILHVDGPAFTAECRGGSLDLEVYGLALAGGRVVDVLSVRTSIDLARRGGALRTDGLRVFTAFVVPSGSADLRLFVRAGRATGSTRQLISLPEQAPGELLVLAPVLVRPLGDSAALPAGTRGRPTVTNPFRVESESFVPDDRALEPGRARQLFLFAWRAPGSQGPLEMKAELSRPGTAPIPLPLAGDSRVATDADGASRAVASVVPPPGAAPGDYTLRLAIREPGTDRVAQSESTVRLEN